MSATEIFPPDAPSIAGLRFRPVAGPEDAAALCAVHAARLARDGVDPRSTYEDLPGGVEELGAVLSEVRAAGRAGLWPVAEVDGRVVGYGALEDWPEDDGRQIYLVQGWVLPEWRGAGIGTALLRWVESKARELAATERPGARFEFAANASSTEAEGAALLAAEGYAPGYTVLEMVWDSSAPIEETELPEGLELRPALPEHYRLIADSVDEAYRREYAEGRYQERFDPADFAARIAAPKHDPGLWRIAWAGDRVVGQAMAIASKGRTEIFEVSVRPAWRRRGLARALMSRLLSELRDRGCDPVMIHTVAEFRTRASELYRGLNFRIAKEFPRYRKEP